MADTNMVTVINRAKYSRPYLVRKVEFEPLSVNLIDVDELDALINNSPEYKQLNEKGALVVQGTQNNKVRIANTTQRTIVIRYPKVLLHPGENAVRADLWDEVKRKYEDHIWLLQGQPDGLIF